MFEFKVGMRICIINDDGYPEYGTIVYIEPDEIPNLYWLYLKSDTDSMNKQTDPKINGYFWRIIDSVSDRIDIA